ncbi:hypothetical protein KQI65_08690 [bacterium]|nr:hypothetical protein [bacterium]
MNIRFEYMYRDAANYKLRDDVVFANRNNLSVDALTTEIQKGLIDGEFFVAEDVGIPPLKFERYDPDLDHGWHWFSEVSLTDDQVTDSEGRDISELISALQSVVQL